MLPDSSADVTGELHVKHNVPLPSFTRHSTTMGQRAHWQQRHWNDVSHGARQSAAILNSHRELSFIDSYRTLDCFPLVYLARANRANKVPRNATPRMSANQCKKQHLKWKGKSVRLHISSWRARKLVSGKVVVVKCVGLFEGLCMHAFGRIAIFQEDNCWPIANTAIFVCEIFTWAPISLRQHYKIWTRSCVGHRY